MARIQDTVLQTAVLSLSVLQRSVLLLYYTAGPGEGFTLSEIEEILGDEVTNSIEEVLHTAETAFITALEKQGVSLPIESLSVVLRGWGKTYISDFIGPGT